VCTCVLTTTRLQESLLRQNEDLFARLESIVRLMYCTRSVISNTHVTLSVQERRLRSQERYFVNLVSSAFELSLSPSLSLPVASLPMRLHRLQLKESDDQAAHWKRKVLDRVNRLRWFSSVLRVLIAVRREGRGMRAVYPLCDCAIYVGAHSV
jgi:hypothetical protein